MNNAKAIVCGFAILLLIVEISLRVAGHLYVSAHFNKMDTWPEESDGAVNILYIGDSWTQGSDAPKGKGYVDILSAMLKEEFPDIKIQQVNLGQSAFNSAEVCIEFLHDYERINPRVLVALFGINNVWNASDVDYAQRRLEREAGGLRQSSGIAGILLSKITKLRISRLISIAWANLAARADKYKGPLPLDPADPYTNRYFAFHSEGRVEEGREYLIKNCPGPSEYDNLYKAFLYSFGYDRGAVESYLKNKGYWHPEWIRYSYDAKKYARYLGLKKALFEKHITCLSDICKKKNIKLVIQTYPYFDSDWCDYLNEGIRQAARRDGIYLVDQASLFRKDLQDNCRMYQTYTHVNGEGHSRMARNLFDFFKKEKLLLN